MTDERLEEIRQYTLVCSSLATYTLVSELLAEVDRLRKENAEARRLLKAYMREEDVYEVPPDQCECKLCNSARAFLGQED